MNLIINSLYSDKDVFLRELVSNAADACDKKRFLSLSGETAVSEGEMEIRVRADKEAGTVTIEDAGVGMTRQELINNLGSIATSGTSKFAEALGSSAKDETSLIGQFGVGFYSAYLVAEKVTVTTKSFTDPDAKQYTWESNADSSFTVTEDGPDAEPLHGASGTRIVLHVKDGDKSYLEHYKLKDLLKRYSEFISFPIMAWSERTEMEEVPDGDEKDADDKPKMKRVPKTIQEWSQVNKLKPIWMRRPREVEEDEYKEFYKSISRDYQEPLAHTHFVVEGDVEFRAILFTPKVVPMELRQNMFDDGGRMLRLYVKRVFISDSFEDLLPRWLCFMRGVVDSDDLPLNVSREILQKSRVLSVISKRLIRKSLDMFAKVKERDNDDFVDFWKEYGRYLKAGIVESGDYTEDLARLSLWPSTDSKDKFTSLDKYVGRMKENQSDIYYVTGSSRAQGEAAPAMEKLRSLGYEVIFLVEPVDEIAIQNLVTYKTKKSDGDAEPTTFKFVDVSKDSLDLGELTTDEEKADLEKAAEDFKGVQDFLTTLLKNKVGKVAVSSKLTESAAAITQSSYGMTPTMEKYMKEVGAGAMADPGMSGYLTQSRTLEINPRHPLVVDIKLRLEGATGGDDDQTRQTATLIYELALLTGGYDVGDTAAFARRVSSFVSSAVTAPSVEMPAPDAEPDAEPSSMEKDVAAAAAGGVPSADIMQAIQDAGIESKDVEVM
jgi:molecular chaperone HtpG